MYSIFEHKVHDQSYVAQCTKEDILNITQNYMNSRCKKIMVNLVLSWHPFVKEEI